VWRGLSEGVGSWGARRATKGYVGRSDKPEVGGVGGGGKIGGRRMEGWSGWGGWGGGKNGSARWWGVVWREGGRGGVNLG